MVKVANVFKRAYIGETITDVKCPACGKRTLMLRGVMVEDTERPLIVSCQLCRYKVFTNENGDRLINKAALEEVS